MAAKAAVAILGAVGIERLEYVVMEKRASWGAEYSPEKRTDEWE